MKPILIAVFLFASTCTKSFAADGIEPTVLKSFKTTFATATEVDWSLSQDLYKAVFVLNGQCVTAYFKEDGTMQALIRHISPDNLPIILQTALKNTSKEQWVTDVMEVTSEGGLQYFATLESADAQTVLKSSANTWSLFQKQHKD